MDDDEQDQDELDEKRWEEESEARHRQYPQYDLVCEFHQGLARTMLGSKFGYIDAQGKSVISFKYRQGFDFTDGENVTAVRGDTGWGFINDKGEELSPLQYGWVDSASSKSISFRAKGGLVAVKLMATNKWGFVDTTGKEVIPTIYDSMLNFNYGLCCVQINGKWGFIDRAGTMAIPAIFDQGGTFEPRDSYDGHKPAAEVKIHGRSYHIHTNGTPEGARNPILAAVLSLVFPGLGNFYVFFSSKWSALKAIGYFIVGLILALAKARGAYVVTAAIAALDAYLIARNTNVMP